MIRMLRPAALSRAARLAALVSLVWIAGCSTPLLRPTVSPTGEDAAVVLRDLQIDTTDGNRAVFLRLSRVPASVRHMSSRRPAQITVVASGPVGDGDMPERDLPQLDQQITQVRVSRKAGSLRVVLDLQGEDPPPYSVHEMADWIMIRLGGPQS
jgi:hypothetical protein